MSPRYIYGHHDPGGESLMVDAPGTIVYTVNVAEDTPIDFSALAERGYRALVRLNHSHNGQGTIPPNAADWPTFAETCALFVAGCRGVRDFTLGNEPNLAVEWGRPEPVLPEQYAHCYNLVHAAVKARKPRAQLAPAAIGPWNLQSGVEWVNYFKRMLDAIPHTNIDFLCLHAYSRGYSPQSVTDNAWMDAPHHNRHNGFRAYKDFLEAVPAGLRDRPVDIKETNGNEPWPDQNTGWVQAAYAEIHRHNTIVGSQKIRSLCLFRWAHFDTRWDFSNKAGVHADFRAAVANKYAAPGASIAAQPTPQPQPVLNLPTVSAGPVAALPPRDWDERLTARGVQIETPALQPGAQYWRVIRGVWMDESEAGGRHHIYVDALDEQGQRVPGVQFGVTWPSGAAMITTEAKPGEEWAGNFPMSPSRNEFSIRPMEAGDAVNGIGMGADMGDGFNSNFHTSTGLVFQRSRAQATQPQPEIPAQTMYVNSPDGLKIRAGPGISFAEVGGLPHRARVSVQELATSDLGNVWARINTGFVAHWLLSDTEPEPVPVAPHPPQVEPTVPVTPAQPPAGIIDPLAGQAIIQIESGGQGFGPGNRLLIRFENHLFNRHTSNAHAQLFRQGDPPWTGHQWRRNASEAWQDVHTGNQVNEWAAFDYASILNRHAALQSISMGAGQILGSHYGRLGYATPEAMFRAFGDRQYGMAAQMLGFVNFFLSDARLFEAMRDKDFLTVATIYNGPGQAAHYANLMRQAYERLR